MGRTDSRGGMFVSQKYLPDIRALKFYLCSETPPCKNTELPTFYNAAIGNDDLCRAHRGAERRLLVSRPCSAKSTVGVAVPRLAHWVQSSVFCISLPSLFSHTPLSKSLLSPSSGAQECLKSCYYPEFRQMGVTSRPPCHVAFGDTIPTFFVTVSPWSGPLGWPWIHVQFGILRYQDTKIPPLQGVVSPPRLPWRRDRWAEPWTSHLRHMAGAECFPRKNEGLHTSLFIQFIESWPSLCLQNNLLFSLTSPMSRLFRRSLLQCLQVVFVFL